jgi:hypothetical protein
MSHPQAGLVKLSVDIGYRLVEILGTQKKTQNTFIQH